jgi:NADH:ubiquinone oxidoreductase subunit 6 (subunit J)
VKVLGAAVLVMESLVMGFALLLAQKHASTISLILGGAIAVLFLFSAGMLRITSGWILGSLLQVAMTAYGVIITPLFFLGVLFSGLWIAAILVGLKGEAARTALLKARESTAD